MSEGALFTLLIPAVGGQGGGVLSEWVVEAAHAAGLQAHGTSIPGVAQRTGSTTYYVELFTGDGEPPAFSLYPIPGALDVLLAPELLEVGRMIELGFPSPSRTTIVASTHRLYSIHEKISTSGSVYPSDRLIEAARAFSTRLVAFDVLALAREHGTEANAILLGALAGSQALPIAVEAYRAAIRGKGIQVTSNLAGFELGWSRVAPADRVASNGGATAWAGTDAAERPVPGGVERATRRRDARTEGRDAGVTRAVTSAATVRKSLRDLISTARGADDHSPETDVETMIADLPGAVRRVARQAIPRLIDYQDCAYAERYLEKLRPFVRDDADPALAALVARLLAVWMTYEDAIRVADLKTRRSRFERIRVEARAPDAEIVVTDYLKPDLDEIYGILPDRIVAPFARWAERRWPHGRPTLGQHVKTTTVSGYLRVWLLARLRRLRPISHRARIEHGRMDRWLEAVARSAACDPALGLEVARAASLVKGYGEVRRRLAAVFDDLLASVTRAVEIEQRAGEGFAASRHLAERYRALALRGPDGEADAALFARERLAKLESNERPTAVVPD